MELEVYRVNYSVKGSGVRVRAEGFQPGRDRLFADREKAVEYFRKRVILHWKEYQAFVGEMQGLSEDDIWRDRFLKKYGDRETEVCWSNRGSGDDWLQWRFCFFDFLEDKEYEYCYTLSKLNVLNERKNIWKNGLRDIFGTYSGI